jgi:hypothetical protein
MGFKRHILKPGVVFIPVISVLWRWRQENLEFKTNLGYIMSSKPVWATWRNPISKPTNKNHQKTHAFSISTYVFKK